MASILERHIESIHRRLILLPPRASLIPGFFSNVSGDILHHDRLMSQLQRLRGRIYLSDGALHPHELSADGLHQTEEDAKSWHLLMLDNEEDVSSCIWYMEHPRDVPFGHLKVQGAAVAGLPCPSLERAVKTELARAKRQQVAYAEVGGWAVSDGQRHKPDGLLLILATFGLSRILGGALGVSTATLRHSSATILRRLGLSHLKARGGVVPRYYDSRYDCEMEVLRFDTRRSTPRYHDLIEQLKAGLAKVAVIARYPGDAAQALIPRLTSGLSDLMPGSLDPFSLITES